MAGTDHYQFMTLACINIHYAKVKDRYTYSWFKWYSSERGHFLKEVPSINVYTLKCDHVSSFHSVKTFDNIFDGGS